jgi:hypothetical protein
MRLRMTTLALLSLGLATATQAVATPSTFGPGQSDDRMEAAPRLSFNLCVGRSRWPTMYCLASVR